MVFCRCSPKYSSGEHFTRTMICTAVSYHAGMKQTRGGVSGNLRTSEHRGAFVNFVATFGLCTGTQSRTKGTNRRAKGQCLGPRAVNVALPMEPRSRVHTSCPQGMMSLNLMTKEELRIALNLPSTKMVDELVRKRKIQMIRLGHRTVRFNLAKVVAALERLELKAVGQK